MIEFWIYENHICELQSEELNEELRLLYLVLKSGSVILLYEVVLLEVATTPCNFMDNVTWKGPRSFSYRMYFFLLPPPCRFCLGTRIRAIPGHFLIDLKRLRFWLCTLSTTRTFYSSSIAICGITTSTINTTKTSRTLTTSPTTTITTTSTANDTNTTVTNWTAP